MGFLRKLGLSCCAVFNRISLPSPLFPRPFFNCIPGDSVFLGRFVSVLVCMTFAGILPSVFAETALGNGARLKTLKIEAFKRELRLPEPSAPHHEPLYTLYVKNRFQDIVRGIDRLPPDQKDARILMLYGNSLLITGQQTEAVTAFQAAFQKTKSPRIKSAALANFALVFSISQRWSEAVRWLEKALEIDREADHWAGQGLALSQLGAFYFKLGDTQKGAAAHIEALEIAETIPIPWLEARQLSQLASLYYRDQTFPLAREYYEKALKIYETLEDPLSEAGTLSALSFVYKDLGRKDAALSLQSKALARYEALQDEDNLSKTWLNLSLLHRDQGRYPDALHAAEQALHIQAPLGDPRKLAEIEGTIGTIYEKRGELTQALRHLKKARAYFEETGASQEIHIVDLRIQRLQDQMP